MAYRIHRDGYIQARSIELQLPADVFRRAITVGQTRLEGIEREVEKLLGVEIEGVLRFRIIDQKKGLVRLESDWVRPSRS